MSFKKDHGFLTTKTIAIPILNRFFEIITNPADFNILSSFFYIKRMEMGMVPNISSTQPPQIPNYSKQ